MGSLPIACGSPRARGANVIYSTMAWRVVVLSFMLLLGESLASQSRLLNTDYGDCGGKTSLIANGVCDASVNTADCGFDGGDCCECTCILANGDPCDRAETFFSCRDPDAPVDCDSTESQRQVLTATSDYSQCLGHIPHIRDGRCDEANNNADCGFDGGDCCPSTCAGGMTYACGDQGGGFDCRDPHAISPRRRLITSSASCGGITGSIGDTGCDSVNNNFECGYDGGDCCECTCAPDLTDPNIEGVYWTNRCLWGEFDCIDPSADCESSDGITAPNPTPSPVYTSPVPSPTVSPVASPTARPLTSPIVSPVPSPTPIPASSPTYTSSECGWPDAYLGDGSCDSSANNLECDWDGGDCCRCTCEDTYYYKCSELDVDCLDPYAPTDCESDSSVTSPSPAATPAPGPIYISPEPSPTARPVASTTDTSVESDSDSPAQSDSVLDDDSSTGSGGLQEEGADANSATLTATRGTSVFNWEVVGLVSASVLGYCFIGE